MHLHRSFKLLLPAVLGLALGAAHDVAAAPNQSPILKSFKCPKPPAGGCKGPKDCLYPHPKSKKHYVQCNDAGIAYQMPCPEGLLWNNKDKICDWPEHIK